MRSDTSLHRWAMFELVERSVDAPDGSSFSRTFVHTPGAVATVAITDAGDVVLVEQFRASLGGTLLELPAGMRDVDGEDPAETARRELREETGYVATDLEPVGTCYSSPGVTDSSVMVYLATGLVRGRAETHGPEEDEMLVHEIGFAAALEMISDGRIRDSKTVFGLLLVARMRPALVG